MTKAEYRRRRKELIEVAVAVYNGPCVSGDMRTTWAVRKACDLIDRCDLVMKELEDVQRRERASSPEVGEGRDARPQAESRAPGDRAARSQR